MGGIYMSCPGYQHWKPVNKLSHKVLSPFFSFKRALEILLKTATSNCCNVFEPHHLLSTHGGQSYPHTYHR